MSNYPTLALTPGEPAGIGPDLTVQIAQKQHRARLVVIADPDLLHQRAEQLNLPLTLRSCAHGKANPVLPAGELYISPVKLNTACTPGILTQANADYVLRSLSVAAQGCLDGCFDAMVTAPVHKGIINESGFAFSGHTEFLADFTHTDHVVMMLAANDLRVALVTTHLPLAKVASAITPDLLSGVIRILHQDLVKKFGILQPRILVCGLNPHAGESGHMGREEIDIIEPVIKQLNGEGMHLVGPLPADTLFTPKYLDQADAVLAMYHDQGLPVLKYAGFGNAVNITLGLPVIRTSVDHGTALDLAGTGTADTGSLMVAIENARAMAEKSMLLKASP